MESGLRLRGPAPPELPASPLPAFSVSSRPVGWVLHWAPPHSLPFCLAFKSQVLFHGGRGGCLSPQPPRPLLLTLLCPCSPGAPDVYVLGPLRALGLGLRRVGALLSGRAVSLSIPVPGRSFPAGGSGGDAAAPAAEAPSSPGVAPWPRPAGRRGSENSCTCTPSPVRSCLQQLYLQRHSPVTAKCPSAADWVNQPWPSTHATEALPRGRGKEQTTEAQAPGPVEKVPALKK